MQLIHESALYLHIAVGACALLLFWVPVFTRKGNMDHKRFGRIFGYAMYTVAGSGVIMSGLDLLFPLAMHAEGLELDAGERAAAIQEVRQFALFLFSLSILVLTSTRHGWQVILHKDDRQALRRPSLVGLNGLLAGIGLLLLTVGIQTGTILFMIFGTFQLAAGIGNLRYIFRAEIRPRQWWTEHLGGLIGSGVGAYTAFTVFGGRRLFEELFASNFDSYAVFLWIGPSVIGVIATTLLSRHYRIRFSGEWAMRRARLRSGLAG